MNVSLKLVNSIMTEHGLYWLQHSGQRKPNLIGVDTPVDLVNRGPTNCGAPTQDRCTPQVAAAEHGQREITLQQ